jgi:hypothetical protein
MISAAAQHGCHGHDRLDRRWLIAVYGVPLLPFGPAVVILGTSLLYYVWRKRHPRRASELNLHAWIAVAVGLAMAVGRSSIWH